MWCKVCQNETENKVCDVCGTLTVSDVPMEIYYCSNCKIPIIRFTSELKKREKCSCCGKVLKRMASDVRPVFPMERMLAGILLENNPFVYQDKSVWADGSRYYIDGKSKLLKIENLRAFNVDNVRDILEESKTDIRYEKIEYAFEDEVQRFIEVNSERYAYIDNEAQAFIRDVASKYEHEQIVLSFSGGKDSTVTADLVVRALSDSSLVHIFGDTTLEFPMTMEYSRRFRENHPKAIFKIAKNKEQNFYDMCSDIGPPARMMRWCCTMFKTGPITRVLNKTFRNQHVLTFYGIRKYESASRSKYDRVAENNASVKIQKQTVASPVFLWKDIDIWLYIFTRKIDFNDAYRLGYDRVGCWCCPNNTIRAQFLSSIYMPEQSKKWRDFLIDFAKKIGKPDAEEYVDSGNWKSRQGGNGLKAANDVKLKFNNCTAEDNAKIYSINKPFSDELLNLFIPFGKISKELGRKLIHEVLVLEPRTNVPIMSIQPFDKDDYAYGVKIRTMNVDNHEDLQRMAGYQIRKYNACRRCLKCESLCRHGAILIKNDEYIINPDKCKHCHICVTAKYLDGGCLMDKFLRTLK